MLYNIGVWQAHPTEIPAATTEAVLTSPEEALEAIFDFTF